MTTPVEPLTEPVDRTMLARLARMASGRNDLHLEGWQVATLSGGFGSGTQVQRISGVGMDENQAFPWSIILKTIRCEPDNSGNPLARKYWKREPYFYTSGLLENLPDGLRAARCYGAIERADCYQLFLEDLQETCYVTDPSQGWSPEEYLTAARCLGRFKGAYLAGKPLPEGDSIPRHWFRTYLEESASNMDWFSRSTDHPLVRRCLGELPADLILKAWEQREKILAALEQLPQVFCHNDAFLRNLFFEKTDSREGRERLVAIDWSYAGPGALGTDLALLVSASMGLGNHRFSEGERIAQFALEGYLDGLEQVGWHGNPDLVRFGFSTSCFWRYPIGMLIGEFITIVLDKAKMLGLEQKVGISFEQVADIFGAWMSWSLPYYEETWRLKKKLNL